MQRGIRYLGTHHKRPALRNSKRDRFPSSTEQNTIPDGSDPDVQGRFPPRTVEQVPGGVAFLDSTSLLGIPAQHPDVQIGTIRRRTFCVRTAILNDITSIPPVLESTLRPIEHCVDGFSRARRSAAIQFLKHPRRDPRQPAGLPEPDIRGEEASGNRRRVAQAGEHNGTNSSSPRPSRIVQDYAAEQCARPFDGASRGGGRGSKVGPCFVA